MFLFTKNDVDNFVHVMRCDDDSYLIVQKDSLHEMDVNAFHVVKPDFNISTEYTNLLAAKEMCLMLLDLLGVNVYNKHTQMGLSIEVIKDDKTKDHNLI